MPGTISAQQPPKAMKAEMPVGRGLIFSNAACSYVSTLRRRKTKCSRKAMVTYDADQYAMKPIKFSSETKKLVDATMAMGMKLWGA